MQYLKYYRKPLETWKAYSSSLNLTEEKLSLRNDELSKDLRRNGVTELHMLCGCFFFFSFFFFFWALSVILGRSPGPAETISCLAKAAHFSLWNISHFTFSTFLLQETVWKHNGVVNELLRIWKRGTIWGVLQHAWHRLLRFPLISSRGTDFRYYICISTCMYKREEDR